MAIELNGPERAKLRDAILSAYPSWGDLQIMVSDQLDESLPQISAQANQRHVAFNLIEWARARGRLAELIEGARRSNPDNNQMFVFVQKLGLASTDAKKSILEKVVGQNTTFLDVAAWRAQLTRSEWRVCRVDLDGSGNGTGFLVGPDAVLTNHHVVSSAIDGNRNPNTITCRFDYKLAPAGDVISNGESFQLADDWLIDSLPPSPVDVVPDPKPNNPSDEDSTTPSYASRNVWATNLPVMRNRLNQGGGFRSRRVKLILRVSAWSPFFEVLVELQMQ
jgi:hypothetical protein